MLSVGSPRELKTTPRVSLSRSRLKKGKALAKRKTIQEVMIEQDERGTRLPNIRTSQLVGLSKIGNAGSELAKSSRTEKVKYLRPRRMSVPTFRDESFDIVDADNLDGLIIVVLNVKIRSTIHLQKTVEYFHLLAQDSKKQRDCHYQTLELTVDLARSQVKVWVITNLVPSSPAWRLSIQSLRIQTRH